MLLDRERFRRHQFATIVTISVFFSDYELVSFNDLISEETIVRLSKKLLVRQNSLVNQRGMAFTSLE